MLRIGRLKANCSVLRHDQRIKIGDQIGKNGREDKDGDNNQPRHRRFVFLHPVPNVRQTSSAPAGRYALQLRDFAFVRMTHQIAPPIVFARSVP